ncbi:MAG: cell division protein ZapA [Angelakisella sp.]
MNRIKVDVLGKSYTINTESDESRVRQIEKQLSAQLEEITGQRPNISMVDALVILSLNLMDSISDTEDSTDRMREQLSGYMEDAARAQMELEEARREAERLKRELAIMKNRGGDKQ